MSLRFVGVVGLLWLFGDGCCLLFVLAWCCLVLVVSVVVGRCVSSLLYAVCGYCYLLMFAVRRWVLAVASQCVFSVVCCLLSPLLLVGVVVCCCLLLHLVAVAVAAVCDCCCGLCSLALLVVCCCGSFGVLRC